MFTVDGALKSVPAQRAQVLALHASLNKPHLAVPGKPAQEAQAYICALRNPNGSFTLVVSLFLVQTNELVQYTDADRREVDANGYTDAEADALGFVESMGFMLENLNFRKLPPAQQDELLRTLPPFGASARPAPRPADAEKDKGAVTPTVAAKLARLFAAF